MSAILPDKHGYETKENYIKCPKCKTIIRIKDKTTITADCTNCHNKLIINIAEYRKEYDKKTLTKKEIKIGIFIMIPGSLIFILLWYLLMIFLNNVYINSTLQTIIAGLSGVFGVVVLAFIVAFLTRKISTRQSSKEVIQHLWNGDKY